MDPWTISRESVKIIETFEKPKEFLSFEDNFIDSLPDSKEYIAILESKLKKLKSNPSFIKQLQEKREACMRELLCDMTNCPIEIEEDFLKEELQTYSILRTIAPEKQALSKGEIVEFIKYDQLINETHENEDSAEVTGTLESQKSKNSYPSK
ncbi:uncharacterized protein LOC108738863 [Agrilus planipennis]|uniref:Uncharacterized protein LOC108738863 n=1 Tax=Agrilus planipennis TaxID=224129 RepID=A0A1W4WVR1_AGRPL|nr:uncharacterized protein LOC108738863 [Agrilus planipennis]XP_025833533.1 uncharacterized protein LOC108738863 [Agrilus planipennis]